MHKLDVLNKVAAVHGKCAASFVSQGHVNATLDVARVGSDHASVGNDHAGVRNDHAVRSNHADVGIDHASVGVDHAVGSDHAVRSDHAVATVVGPKSIRIRIGSSGSLSLRGGVLLVLLRQRQTMALSDALPSL
jgi:hypothetical protein